MSIVSEEYDFNKRNSAFEKHQSAMESARNGALSAAIETIKEAERLFLEDHNRHMYVVSKSNELKWLYDENPETFYERHEGDILRLLEDFEGFSSLPEYVRTRFHYLKYQSKKLSSGSDFINARDALNELADMASENRESLSHFVSGNQIRIWRTQAKVKEAQASSARKDDLATQAEYYLEAADLSTPALDGGELSAEMRVHRYDLLSSHHKLLGFSLLHVDKVKDFEKVAKNMQLSLEYAEEACRLSENDARKKHRAYVSYWSNVFGARNAMTKTWFNSATKHLNQAIKDARYLLDQGANIFPNYYSDADDLSNDRLFVRAYELLDSGDLEKSAAKLQKWLKMSKNKGTWRYSSIKLRFLAVQALAALDSSFGGAHCSESEPFKVSACRLQKEIDQITDGLNLGKASETIAEKIVFLVLDYERGQLTIDGLGRAFEEICELFPTDSVVENYDRIATISLLGRRAPLELIPSCFGKEIERIQRLKDCKQARDSLDKLVRCYALVLIDYYHSKYADYAESNRVQALSIDTSRPFDELPLKELMERLSSFVDAFERNGSVLEPLKQYVSVRTNAEGGLDFAALLKTASRAITRTSTALFPHIIRVASGPEKDEDKSETLQGFYVCERMWKKEWPRELLFGSEWPLSVGRFYFLQPGWKNRYFEKAGFYRADVEIYESKMYHIVENDLREDIETEGQENLKWRLPTLDDKIEELQDLITRNATEHEIGLFLYKNHWIFGESCKEFVREPRIDLDNRSDFFLVTSRNERVIVEIKRPGERLFEIEKESSATSIWPKQPRLCPSKELTKAINQLREYQEAWKTQSIVRFGCGGPVCQPKGILLIGSALTEVQSQKLQQIKDEEKGSHREIISYDDLMSQAKGIVALLRGLLTEKQSTDAHGSASP